MKTIIAAQPGFDVVELLNDPAELAFRPVVAWLIIHDDDDEQPLVQPLMPGWECNNPENALRYPDGQIWIDGGPTFAKGQEAKALAHLIERQKKRRAA